MWFKSRFGKNVIDFLLNIFVVFDSSISLYSIENKILFWIDFLNIFLLILLIMKRFC